MAIDYGAKRVGIAVTDPLQIIATALDTVDTACDCLAYLEAYFKRETVDKLVVGMPYNHGYAENAVMPKILLFITQFKQKYPSR
jgi:putative Holliday junction resolvase